MDHSGHNMGMNMNCSTVCNMTMVMPMMPMTFGWTIDKDFSLLWANWKLNTPVKYYFSLLVVIFAAFFYEVLTFVRYRLELTAKRGERYALLDSTNNSVSDNTTTGPEPPVLMRNHFFVLALRTALHVSQLALSYGLMLAAMTYNGPIILCILFGAAVGYFLFGHFRRINPEDPIACHSS